MHKNDYSLICKHAAEMESIDFNDYTYCMCLTMSRGFKLSMDGQQGHNMVPYADMLNHQPYPL